MCGRVPAASALSCGVPVGYLWFVPRQGLPRWTFRWQVCGSLLQNLFLKGWVRKSRRPITSHRWLQTAHFPFLLLIPRSHYTAVRPDTATLRQMKHVRYLVIQLSALALGNSTSIIKFCVHVLISMILRVTGLVLYMQSCNGNTVIQF